MKHAIGTCILSFLLTIGLFAQDRTLFNENDNLNVGGFGGPIFQISNIGDQTVAAVAGGGGVTLNDFFIGAFGGGVGVERWSSGLVDYDVDLGYGGLWLGYSLLDDKLVHPYVSLQAAVGNLDIGNHDLIDITVEEFTVGIVQPEIGAEINLTEWFKLSTTIGYRWINNFDQTDIITSEDIRSFYLGFSLRFGSFGG
ncbi:MAG: hypothetical protein AAGI23_21520 [Bacteroidota bacterium]